MAKSSKQRRAEIRAERMRKAKKAAFLDQRRSGNFPWEQSKEIRVPENALKADWGELRHNNTYGPLPLFYMDKVFYCASCKSQELWTAKQQRWWYEIAKGDINSTAKYCRACRDIRKGERDRTRAIHIVGLVEKRGIRDAAKQLQKPPEELRSYLAGIDEDRTWPD